MEARGVAAIPKYRFSRLRLQRLGTAMDGWVKCQVFVRRRDPDAAEIKGVIYDRADSEPC
jgi:hypothetical protein